VKRIVGTGYLHDSQFLPSYIIGHSQVYERAGKSSWQVPPFLHLPLS